MYTILKHKLKDIDENKMKATCSICGNVHIIRGTNGWRCYKRHAEYKIRKKGYKNLPKEIKTKGYCKICKIYTKLVVDHNHKNLNFRGFLCGNCNCLLGFSKDNISILENAIKYLKNT